MGSKKYLKGGGEQTVRNSLENIRAVLDKGQTELKKGG